MSGIVAALLAVLMSWAGAPATPGIAMTDPGTAVPHGPTAGGPTAGGPTAGGPTASGSVRLMVVGDMMLARGVGDRISAEGTGAPFRRVQAILDRSDLLIGNLECVVSTRGTKQPKLYTFRARPRSVGALRKAGFDLVGLANNHALDYGRVALGDTIRSVHAAGIAVMGAGSDAQAARAPVIVERNGLRIAFLDRADAYLDSNEWPSLDWEATAQRSGLAYARPRELRADVGAARKHADVVVVMLHSGREYAKGPTKHQRRVVEAAVAGGAALVVSAHPHVLQRGERIGIDLCRLEHGQLPVRWVRDHPGRA